MRHDFFSLSLLGVALVVSHCFTRRTEAANVPGLIGDGIADDSDAIQRAIHAKLGELQFSKGKYRLAKTIEIDLDQVGFTSLQGGGVATFIMTGPGPAFRWRGTHEGSADPNSFKDNVWERQRSPMIDGIEIIGSHPDASGIEADGTMQLTVTRTVVRKAKHALHLVTRNRNVIVSDCHFYENRGIGIFLDDVNLHQINVVGSHISYNDMGGIVSVGGNVRNLHVTGCDIESNMSPSQSPTANILIDCRASEYGTAEVSITGCTIQHNSRSKGSANIRIHGQGREGSRSQETRWGNVTITGNIMSDVETNIDLDGCRGVTLSGNTCWMGYAHNLRLNQCRHVLMTANNFDRNPRYSYGDATSTKNLIAFTDCEDLTISGLHVSHVVTDGVPILFERCRRINFSSSSVLDCSLPSIVMRDVSNSLISSLLVSPIESNSKVQAIQLEHCQNTIVKETAMVAPSIAK